MSLMGVGQSRCHDDDEGVSPVQLLRDYANYVCTCQSTAHRQSCYSLAIVALIDDTNDKRALRLPDNEN
jgi:hypothetical protein